MYARVAGLRLIFSALPCCSAVLDEVDILYDDQEFAEVLEMVEQSASKRLQFVHVTATLPVDIHDSLLARYPDSLPLMGPSLHRTAVGLQEVLNQCIGSLFLYSFSLCSGYNARLFCERL